MELRFYQPPSELEFEGYRTMQAGVSGQLEARGSNGTRIRRLVKPFPFSPTPLPPQLVARHRSSPLYWARCRGYGPIDCRSLLLE